MRRADVESLDPRRTYWVPSVVAPCRDWAGAPGCRCGARFLVDGNLHANRDEFAAFGTRLGCLNWIMRHRSELNRSLPDASIRVVSLDRWLLGLD